MARNTNEYFYETIYNLLHTYNDEFEIIDEFDIGDGPYCYIFIGDELIEGVYAENPRRIIETGTCEFNVYIGHQSKEELREKTGKLLEYGRMAFTEPANPTAFTYTYDRTDQYTITIKEIYATEIFKVIDEMDGIGQANITGEIKYTKRSL